ncbi:MAG: 16S rRNA (guanine(527)-N(7))-methyltransferase RsmG [Gammaproteobacteria bacterium]|nr:16S rRNA (guanine(527)-N(7))-methyltransferase RsmG [Gammaproteobacteria bacterium]
MKTSVAPSSVQISGPSEFANQFSVSSETLSKLELYADLLRRWQKKINLVSRSTIDEIWSRHFADSAELSLHVPKSTTRWVDLGSGAGFPGLVIALCTDDSHVDLVESNERKCAFLREVIRKTGANASVENKRIEKFVSDTYQLNRYDVVIARALAPLDRLIELTKPFFDAGVIGIFPRGQDVESELTRTTKYWNIDAEIRHRQFGMPGSVLIVRSVQSREQV